MRKCKIKNCVVCGLSYQPTGRCSKYCPDCKPEASKKVQHDALVRWSFANGIRTGKGSGSTSKGTSNPMYKHGRSIFRRWAKERKETKGTCEFCGVNIKTATQHEWVGHHKDHNKQNNSIKNLILLCKRCHQIEHKCWKAFEGATTISKESRADNSPKRPTP